jgi:hypothetical protein
VRLFIIAAACAALAGCESNPSMSQAERDYKFQRSMQILQQWQASQPQAPALQPNVRMNCRHFYVGNTLRTECM